ncbi:hypothetical protein V6Z92_001159 [Aspergillus fumigatus]
MRSTPSAQLSADKLQAPLIGWGVTLASGQYEDGSQLDDQRVSSASNTMQERAGGAPAASPSHAELVVPGMVQRRYAASWTIRIFNDLPVFDDLPIILTTLERTCH